MYSLSKTKKEKYLEELFDFLKIPSISADPNYKTSVKDAADWLAKSITKAKQNLYKTNNL